jgi:hypothetical protein
MKLGPATGFALAVTMMGCRHPSTEGMGVADVVAAAIVDGPPGLLPARCRRTDAAFVLDDGQGLGDLEVGDGIAYPGGYAVGIAHRTGAGRVAAIALLHREPTGLTRILDLGPTTGDAPPPRIGWRGGELVGGQVAGGKIEGGQVAGGQLVAAAYVSAIPPAPGTRPSRGDATRDVAIYTVAGGVTAGPPLSISQRRDDSLALDLALAGPAGVLVWDETTTAARGVVKAAAFTTDLAAAGRDVSPPDSDAELPRVVTQGGAFAVIWIARRPEPASGLDGSAAEAVGEARAFGWLEMVHVDGQGAAIGPVRRLTSPLGHVSAYDVEARDPPAGSGTSSLLIVVRDDGEAVDGSGGALLRVRVSGDVVEPPVAFATDGLGRGAPSFVSAAGAEAGSAPALALAWVASGEQARLIPLDAVGAPTAAPSAEDDLSEARALLFMGGPSSAPPKSSALEVLVATPSDSAAQLRVFACSR